MEQLRSSSGATFANGCLTEDGKLSWAMMSARMSGARVVKPIKLPPLSRGDKCIPVPEDYALPAALVGLAAGRVYRVLLAHADLNGMLPSFARIAVLADLNGDCIHHDVARHLQYLHATGFIVYRTEPSDRSVVILATGQLLQSVGRVVRVAP